MKNITIKSLVRSSRFPNPKALIKNIMGTEDSMAGRLNGLKYSFNKVKDGGFQEVIESLTDSREYLKREDDLCFIEYCFKKEDGLYHFYSSNAFCEEMMLKDFHGEIIYHELDGKVKVDKRVKEYTMKELVKLVGHEFKIKK